jgi:hypothetical protein
MAGDRPHPPIVGSGTPRSTLVDTAIQAVQAAGDDPVTGFHSQHLRARDGPGFGIEHDLGANLVDDYQVPCCITS